MRRVLASAVLIGGLLALALLAMGSGGSSGGHTYTAQLDNAFGLTQGGDLKVAGVRVGKISEMKLDQRTHYANVKFSINQTGWGSLRADTTCETRPQSLIGEYFLDCNPGTSPQELRAGATIPVSRTHSTISPDLVQDIMRYPYRTRLSIILNEFGAAVGGNGPALNEAIRRSVPALRETDRVLGILAKQNRILADLATNGDQVVSALAANRADVGRWVVSAGRAATASAERQADIAAGFRKLPGFLAQLRPAMQALGTVADQQTPALRDLGASSGQLKTLFDRLGPFARASTPAFRAFGQAAVSGRRAVRAARSTVAQLNTFSRGAPELGQNLAQVLEHLDSRANAVERDPRSPGGVGWTGLEDLLNYVFWQSSSINLFDSVEHLLNVSVFVSGECAPAAGTVAATVKAKPELAQHCADYLGPTQPGINAPDPTAPGGARATARRAQARQRSAAQSQQAQAGPGAPNQGAQTPPPGGGGPAPAAGPGLRLPKLSDVLPGARLPSATGGPLGVPVPPGLNPALGTSTSAASASDQRHVLDYLLGP